jgi:hypothetical protein
LILIHFRPKSGREFADFCRFQVLSFSEVNTMQERRGGSRYVVSFPIRARWKDENGAEVREEGLTENVGAFGTLVYLPRKLPNVGTKVELTVIENPEDEVTITAEVIRLERNAAHPQVALNLVEGVRAWKKKVYDLAESIVKSQEPDGDDDW